MYPQCTRNVYWWGPMGFCVLGNPSVPRHISHVNGCLHTVRDTSCAKVIKVCAQERFYLVGIGADVHYMSSNWPYWAFQFVYLHGVVRYVFSFVPAFNQLCHYEILPPTPSKTVDIQHLHSVIHHTHPLSMHNEDLRSGSHPGTTGTHDLPLDEHALPCKARVSCCPY